jgi:broad specificity phosphatase PhoE
MANIRLYIVRHGETEANKAGLLQGISPGKLTPFGIEQVKKLALRLQDEKIDVILSSDLERNKQTLVEITKYHDLPVRYLPLIREWNVGEFDLRKKEEFREARAKSGLSKAAFRPKNGENFYDMVERANVFLTLVKSEYKGKHVLVVTHGDFIRSLISVLLNKPVEDAPNIPQDNAALNIFDISPDGVKTVAMNSTEHLGKLSNKTGFQL